MNREKPKTDVEDVRREETRRGRRPVDIEQRRRLQDLKRYFVMYLQKPTEEEFREAMRALGVADGSPRMEEALRIWRTYRES